MVPELADDIGEWWLQCRRLLGNGLRPGFDTLVLLVCWTLWKEWNCQTFRGIVLTKSAIARQLVQEGNEWLDAGYCSLASLASVWSQN